MTQTPDDPTPSDAGRPKIGDKPRGAAGGDLSHDPKTWFRAGGAAPKPDSTSQAGPNIQPAQITPQAGELPAESFEPSTLEAAAGEGNIFLTHKFKLIGGAVAVIALIGAVIVFWPHAKRITAAAPTFATADHGPQKRVLNLAAGQDVGQLLTDAGVTKTDAAGVVAAMKDQAFPDGARVEMTVQPTGDTYALQHIDIRPLTGTGVEMDKVGGAYVAKAITIKTTMKTFDIRGEMDGNSFYTSAVTAGVPDYLIDDIANAFSFDFDFVREIHPGDVFEVVLEAPVNPDGKVAGTQNVLFASLTTPTKSKAFYRFQAPGQAQAQWYDPSGGTAQKSLMRTPVQGARVTSTFGMRNHPVLGYTRMHKGVDFGVPIGTPVYASGDGVVGYVGVHGGHGNYIRIDHTKTLSTAYAHLSAYGDGIVVGTKVHQGQQIALSGNTGLSTGPHLHYEVIVNGEQVDPLGYVASGGETLLQGDALKAFMKERLRIDGARTGG